MTRIAVVFALVGLVISGSDARASESSNPTIGKAFLGVQLGMQQAMSASGGTSFAAGGLIGYNIMNPLGVQVFYFPQIGSTTAQIGGDILLNFGNAIRVFSIGARAAALIGGTGNNMSFGGKAGLEYFVTPEVSAGLDLAVQSGSPSAFILAVAGVKLWM